MRFLQNLLNTNSTNPPLTDKQQGENQNGQTNNAVLSDQFQDAEDGDKNVNSDSIAATQSLTIKKPEEPKLNELKPSGLDVAHAIPLVQDLHLNPARDASAAMADDKSGRNKDWLEEIEALRNKPLLTEEEEKRKKREALISSIGDTVSALSNLYFTTKGAPNAYKPNDTMSAKAKERWDKLVKEREAQKAAALNYYMNIYKTEEQKALGRERLRQDAEYNNARLAELKRHNMEREANERGKADTSAKQGDRKIDIEQQNADSRKMDSETKKIVAETKKEESKSGKSDGKKGQYYEFSIGNNQKITVGKGKSLIQVVKLFNDNPRNRRTTTDERGRQKTVETYMTEDQAVQEINMFLADPNASPETKAKVINKLNELKNEKEAPSGNKTAANSNTKQTSDETGNAKKNSFSNRLLED